MLGGGAPPPSRTDVQIKQSSGELLATPGGGVCQLSIRVCGPPMGSQLPTLWAELRQSNHCHYTLLACNSMLILVGDICLTWPSFSYKNKKTKTNLQRNNPKVKK